MLTCLFYSNKFFQISPPLFSTAKEAEKEKIYHCIHNFVSHCTCMYSCVYTRYMRIFDVCVGEFVFWVRVSVSVT